MLQSLQVFKSKLESEDFDGDSLHSSHVAKRWEESRLAVFWMNMSGDVSGPFGNDGYHRCLGPKVGLNTLCLAT